MPEPNERKPLSRDEALLWMNDHCGSAVAAHVGVERYDYRSGEPVLHHTDVVLKVWGVLRHWRELAARGLPREYGFPDQRLAGLYSISDGPHVSGQQSTVINLSDVPDGAVVADPDGDSLVWNLGKDVWILIEPDQDAIDDDVEVEAHLPA